MINNDNGLDYSFIVNRETIIVDNLKDEADEINKILERMESIANEDGHLSSDEENLLRNININLKTYNSLLSKSDDSEISQDAELHIIEKKIIQDATATAFQDGKMTQEEKRILNELIEFMESIAKTD